MSQSQRAEFTRLRGVRTHNLKRVDCDIPLGKLTVVTGVSGSGKSSLAFDTLYAEGQRRYTESLSTYARQFLQRMQKPPFDELADVQPAVALKQKNEVTNARSTVSTVTELDDHFGLLFTHAGDTACPNCGERVRRDTVGTTVEALLSWPTRTRAVVVAEVTIDDPDHRPVILRQLVGEGFRRFYVAGETVDVAEDDVERLLDQTTYALVIDRLTIDPDQRQRLSEAIETAFGVGKGRLLVYRHGTDEVHVFDRAFRCNACGTDLVEPQPALFSFNSSLGACAACNGYGRSIGLDFKKIIPNTGKTLFEGAIEPFATPKHGAWHRKLVSACTKRGVPIDIPYKRLSDDDQSFVRDGGDGWPGVRAFFEELKDEQYKVHVRVFLAKYRGFDDCVTCKGTRLSQDARNTRVGGKTIADIWRMRIEQARGFFDALELSNATQARVDTVLDEIRYRLSYLDDVGLGYLELGRPSRTLSGGEMQRIHLTTNLGRALTDTLYVLDEPTAGLHARDSQRLLGILKGLRDLGNTVVVVEHDPELIEGADHIVELGPGGGELGGQIVFDGTYDAFLSADTKTRRALDTRLGAPRKAATVIKRASIDIIGASENNLENVTVSLPLGRLVAVTGVSGSGKSTLMHDVFFNNYLKQTQGTAVEAGAVERIEGLEQIREVVLMDQAAIGRSSRSNPLTYSGAYDDVRKLLADTEDAKRRGLVAGDFSFNTPGGRCETCQGMGSVTVEMHFMADIETVCEDCNGRRFKGPVLETRLHGLNITEIFELTVAQAVETFTQHKAIRRKLAPLLDVGLGYLRLGQSTSTLSGGEAQRVKLASYIGQGKSRDANDEGRVLFIFDEPTIGLHLDDVKVLLEALRKLVAQGDSVIVIEHNIDFIAQCDHVVDLGPGAGPQGGRVVALGAPADVAQAEGSITGMYLKEYFDRKSLS